MDEPVAQPTDVTPDVVPAVEQPAPAPAPEVSAEEAAPAEVAPQAPEAPTVVPEVEAKVELEDDPIPTFNIPQYQQPQAQPQAQQVAPLDPSQFSDQYGNVDMGKFAQAMAQRDQQMVAQITQQVVSNVLPQAAQLSAQQLMAARQEERLWQQAEKKYPDLQANKELRDLVHKTRLSVIQGGGSDTPIKAADRLFKYIGKAKEEGQAAATTVIKTQAAATHLETADNTASNTAVQSRELQSRIGSKNRAEARSARESLLKQWMAENKLKID